MATVATVVLLVLIFDTQSQKALEEKNISRKYLRGTYKAFSFLNNGRIALKPTTGIMLKHTRISNILPVCVGL